MTALRHYRTKETDAWEVNLPSDENTIVEGLLKKSPFPIIDMVRSRRWDDLLLMLCQGADLRLQRRAWTLIAAESKKLDLPPQWLNSGFDTVIAKLCFPHLRFAQTQDNVEQQLRYGKSLSTTQVLRAWNNQGWLSKPSQQIALHHLWLESHPLLMSFSPEMLSEGQIVMMALSDPSPTWRQLMPAKARDTLFSIDLGL
ncbi:hypothetical protein [Pseudomonas amygdali]|uniref:Uncharacterized protein n=2 Tax=Pseudomonas amygdali pv. lachrymans TaxID=53707 RepID=A0AAD0V9T8_PSEAV|nr:hypothetical protein [Pseudomonas amygdali]AXH59991.1 hypothetical protein PLA107_032715 [Pseudomonas amygdali pv. lachrymans str. M301315]RMT05724.1 hypothetical protein ALP54_03848 [Pseudomonas amygdali pv. lachrymans]